MPTYLEISKSLNMDVLDKSVKVRTGEEIDAKVVNDYLQEHLKDTNLGEIESIRQYKGGASNLTYELNFPNQSFILRRPPIGKKAKGAHNMAREYDIMSKLSNDYPYVPKMLVHCADESVLGSEFYIMEKLVGMIPRANLPKSLELNTAQVRTMCEAAIDRLIDLHNIDYKKAGFENYYKGEGYVERQVLGWSKRYRKARTPNVPTGENIMAWLEKQMPKDSATCIIHNDYRFDNLVYSPKDSSKVIGVLDWELATVGDPLMDLGGSLAYWVEAKDPYCLRLMRRQPTHLEGMMTRDEVVDYYCKKRNVPKNSMKYYYVFGLFRVAVIAQQIYYRYYHKQTKNKLFATFGVAVGMLLRYCERLIKNKTDQLSQHPMTMLDNLGFTTRILLKKFMG